MENEDKIVITISVIFLIVFSIILILLISHMKDNKINDYSCSEIKSKLISGDCLPSQTVYGITSSCYNILKIKVAYDLMCLNNTLGDK